MDKVDFKFITLIYKKPEDFWSHFHLLKLPICHSYLIIEEKVYIIRRIFCRLVSHTGWCFLFLAKTLNILGIFFKKLFFKFYAGSHVGLHLCSLWMPMKLERPNIIWMDECLLVERFLLFLLPNQEKDPRRCAEELGLG